MMEMTQARLDLSAYGVFFDFDNTVTGFDVLDDIIERFSVDEKWVALEEAWVAGRIGSRECLQGQMESVRITKDALSAYLSKVKVDPFFKDLLSFLRREGVRPVIVSDSFSFLIKTILKANGITGLKIYSNALRFSGDRLIPVFPHRALACSDCANCKKAHVSNHGAQDKMKLYIGDGLSDVCPAKGADLVFAKGKLLAHLQEKNIPCVEFRGLGDVFRYLKEASRGTEA